MKRWLCICAISRFYAIGKPNKLQKAALILRSGSNDVYEGAIYAYKKSFTEYLGLEDMGIFTAFGEENKSVEKMQELRRFGSHLSD